MGKKLSVNFRQGYEVFDLSAPQDYLPLSPKIEKSSCPVIVCQYYSQQYMTTISMPVLQLTIHITTVEHARITVNNTIITTVSILQSTIHHNC